MDHVVTTFLPNELAPKQDTEPRVGQVEFLNELSELLTPKNLAEGIGIGFGGDRRMLNETIDALKLEEMRAQDGPLRIVQATSRDYGSTAYLQTAIEDLSHLSLVNAIDALQAHSWQTTKGNLDDAEFKSARRPATTAIMLASHSDQNGEKQLDIDQPGILIRATYHTMPEFHDEYDDLTEFSLATFIEKQNKDNPGKAVQKLARFMTNRGLELLMPRANYVICIGPIRGNFIGDINGVKVSKYYELSYGHLVQSA